MESLYFKLFKSRNYIKSQFENYLSTEHTNLLHRNQ